MTERCGVKIGVVGLVEEYVYNLLPYGRRLCIPERKGPWGPPSTTGSVYKPSPLATRQHHSDPSGKDNASEETLTI